MAVVIFILAFLIARPFIEALLTAAVVAYIFYPVYRWLLAKTKRPYLSASITVILILLISIAAASLLIGALYKQAYSVYSAAKGGFAIEGFKIFINENINNYITQLLKDSASFISDQASGFLLSIPKKLISMFVALFTIFFLLVNGEQLLKRIKEILPLKEKQKETLEKGIGSMLYAVVFCTIIVSIIQGIIGLIGFYIFRIDHPIFWALILTIAAMIPFVGSWVVWLPAALIKLINGYYAGSNTEIFLSIGLLIYGALLISTIDNIIKPKIIGDRSKLHPVFVLIGVLGGLVLFGFVGVLIGPAIMTLFVNIIEFYRESIQK
ncbi:MAG: AI-2E family transporter [Candidatus Woesearchaeota archaeon]|nr:AI-2E family transporter [Candidatus Woesearchaeota archaeon]